MNRTNELRCCRARSISRIVGFGGLLLAGLFALSRVATASTVAGTPHDLSDRGAPAGNEVCAYCHTPRSTGEPSVALWTGNTTQGKGFTMYGIRAGDLSVSPSFMPPPRGVSMVCLSCHDGATAWDALSANPRVSTAAARQAAVLTVGGLAKDHPVSVAYPPDHDRGVNIPVQGAAGALPLFRDFSDGTESNRVECASCHNPHGGTRRKFLRIGLRGDGLCYNCHVK